MNISQLLGQINDDAPAATTKTASAQGSPSGSDPVTSAVDAALANMAGGNKTASAAAADAPVAALLKVASEVAAADDESNVKLAHRMGAAFVDGMYERQAAYEGASAEAEKTAAAEEAEKQAQFNNGFGEGTELVAKVAAFHFESAHDAIMVALQAG
jgi:hypothetical protein